MIKVYFVGNEIRGEKVVQKNMTVRTFLATERIPFSDQVNSVMLDGITLDVLELDCSFGDLTSVDEVYLSAVTKSGNGK